MKYLLIATMLFICIGAAAQNVGIGTSAPNSNAKLDITATDKGLLIPRMDSVHRKAIPNTIGLLVYDSTTKSFWYNNGNAWQNMAIAVSAWSLTGNSGIDTSIHFLGTKDDNALILKIDNKPAGKIYRGVVSIGADAFSGQIGPGITAIGAGALHSNTSEPGTAVGGYDNTAVGISALFNSIFGYNNTSVGAYTLNQCTTCQGNTAIGTRTLQSLTTGNNNTALGNGTMYSSSTGSSNTAVGSGTFITGGGNENTVMGALALGLSGEASYNTALGYKTLYNMFNGTYNTAVGYKADLLNLSTNIINATAIGANAKVDASNKIRLGDANVTVVESNGVFNTVSDGRFKYNIQENVKGLDFIMKLRPVTYQFDTKKQEQFTKGNLTAAELNSQAMPVALNESNNIKRTGFIAQEVAAAANKTGYDFDGVKIPAGDKQYYSLSYASFVVPLVKAMQEQQQTINDLQKQNELLKQQNQMIVERLKALETKK